MIKNQKKTHQFSPSNIKIKSSIKVHFFEQDKAQIPSETFLWASKKLSLFNKNILQEIKRIDTGRLNIPVYISLCGSKASNLTNTAKQMGKGISPIQAKTSAIMELAERFSFFSHLKRIPFEYFSYAELPQPKINFEEIYKSLEPPTFDYKTALTIFNQLPQRWTKAFNFTKGIDELIPIDWFYSINEYNGPAAGNSQEEALIQSFCELTERHVSAIITQKKLYTPTIDINSIHNDTAKKIVKNFTRKNIKVFLKDFSLNTGIPTIGALCYDPTTFPNKSEIVYTAGTATTPSKALIRALTEVAQLAGDFETGSSYKTSALPKFKTLKEAHYVIETSKTVKLNSLPRIDNKDFFKEIQNCTKVLKNKNFSIYSLDVTHPLLQIPTIYSFIPGFYFAERNINTDIIFHSTKIASQNPIPQNALRILKNMSKIITKTYYLPFFRGLTYLKLEEPQQALSEIELCLNRNPPLINKSSIYTQYAVAFKDLKKYKQAEEMLVKAISFPEVHSETFNLLGFCFFKQDKYEKAIEAFSKAIEKKPGQAINYANIAVNLTRLGETKKAYKMYKEALKLEPELKLAKENLKLLKF